MVVFATFVILVNTATDLIYALVDPQVSYRMTDFAHFPKMPARQSSPCLEGSPPQSFRLQSVSGCLP